MILGIDTGGTFTDFILIHKGRLTTHKVLSTPGEPERAILQGIGDLGLGSDRFTDLQIIHGSTVATNAVLEGKGVATVYITNRGMGDVLTIGRQTRRELYQLQPQKIPPPVPFDHCLETGGRLNAQGELLEPLTDEDIQQLKSAIEKLKPEAVAINLLFSFLDDSGEKQISDAMPRGLFVSRSSRVLPEMKEYERGMATWLNSYVGPLVQGYLHRLRQGVGEARVAVMQSSGGTIDAAQAGEQAVNMLLSGPAGGLAAARYTGLLIGRERLLTFDMGGTSTDVAMIDGELQLTTEGKIAGYPVAVPMVDMHTIGAGGGSIARIDAGGMLQVGPESAGARPGPACYGNGGTEPTVTDANLLLGRLRADAFLGGGMGLDIPAAQQGMQPVAKAMGCSLEEAAEGVIRIANEHMAHALRVMSVQRGIDPRELTLVSFGGAGGLHVCALAEALDMRSAMVPRYAGVLSALGMLVAPKARQLSHAFGGLLDKVEEDQIDNTAAQLAEQGLAALENEGVSREQVVITPSLDLRYKGQSYTLNLPWQGREQTDKAFHDLHEQRYGHQLELPVELVNLRVALSAEAGDVELPKLTASEPAKPVSEISLYGVEELVPVYDRDSLMTGQELTGPLLITETVSTTYVSPGWQCLVHESGALMLQRV